jgi:hypothetical protein
MASTLVPPPLTFVAAAAASATTTTTATSPTTSAPLASAQSGPAPRAAELRLSGNDNGTAIVVGLVLIAIALLFAFLAARKFRQERRIRETVRIQQLLAQAADGSNTASLLNGGVDPHANDDTRSTITQNVRREMAGTASNASMTISPGRPLGGVRRGLASKSPRTPSLASGPLTPPNRSLDRGSFRSDDYDFL